MELKDFENLRTGSVVELGIDSDNWISSEGKKYINVHVVAPVNNGQRPGNVLIFFPSSIIIGGGWLSPSVTDVFFHFKSEVEMLGISTSDKFWWSSRYNLRNLVQNLF